MPYSAVVRAATRSSASGPTAAVRPTLAAGRSWRTLGSATDSWDTEVEPSVIGPTTRGRRFASAKLASCHWSAMAHPEGGPSGSLRGVGAAASARSARTATTVGASAGSGRCYVIYITLEPCQLLVQRAFP